MIGRSKIVGRSMVGDMPSKFTGEIETMIFDLTNFEIREEKRNESIFSCILTAHGHPWKLEVYPKGDLGSLGQISVYLWYAGDITKVDFSLVKATVRTKTISCQVLTGEPIENSEIETPRWGLSSFAQWDEIWLNDLDDDGTLTIFADIEVGTKTAPIWYPRLTNHEEFRSRLYESRMETGDISFLVGKSKKECYAHTIILKLQAKGLYELVLDETSVSDEDSDEEENAIVLKSTDEVSFQSMIEFIYTGKTPTLTDDMHAAESMLTTADYFSCIDLKLYMESAIVEKFLRPSTAAHLLLFADSHNCALLKESAMNAHRMDHAGFIGGEGWDRLKESPELLSELLCNTSSARKSYLPIAEKDNKNRGTEEHVDALDVASLRERLDKAKLDVDGSREDLVDRLKLLLY